MVSILYKNSFIYNSILKILHGNYLKKRYSLISKMIGKNKKVLELGSGTSLIYPYLDKSVEYGGWDLNKIFINDLRKKGLNVKLKSIFDYKDYPKEIDVILIVDLLHHIVPKHEEFIKKIKNKAKMIIIAEPFNSESNFIDSLYSSKNFIINKIMKFINNLIGDDDGINNADALFDWNHNKESLKSMFKKMGAKKIICLGNDLIAKI